MSSLIEYRDPLPEGCPPDEAEMIRNARTVYRFVDRVLVDLRDFRSQRSMQPGRTSWGTADECIAAGLSVFGTYEAAADYLRRQQEHHLDRIRKRWAGKQLCRVALNAGAGAILRTSRGQPTRSGEHWTWWPSSDFDIRRHAAPLQETDKQ